MTEHTVTQKLGCITRAVRRRVQGPKVASVTLLVDGEPRTAVVSDAAAIEVDTAQYIVEEGPCLDATRTARRIRVDARADAASYRRFIPFALQAGISDNLSIPLTLGDVTVGSMNIYSDMTIDRLGEVCAEMAAAEALTVIANSAHRRAHQVPAARDPYCRQDATNQPQHSKY